MKSYTKKLLILSLLQVATTLEAVVWDTTPLPSLFALPLLLILARYAKRGRKKETMSALGRTCQS